MTTEHHAKQLAAYARCHVKYGPDPLLWLPSLIAAEGLTVDVKTLVEQVTTRTIDQIVQNYERRGLPVPDDDALADLIVQHPVMIALMADQLVTRYVTKRVSIKLSMRSSERRSPRERTSRSAMDASCYIATIMIRRSMVRGALRAARQVAWRSQVCERPRPVPSRPDAHLEGPAGDGTARL